MSFRSIGGASSIGHNNMISSLTLSTIQVVHFECYCVKICFEVCLPYKAAKFWRMRAKVFSCIRLKHVRRSSPFTSPKLKSKALWSSPFSYHNWYSFRTLILLFVNYVIAFHKMSMPFTTLAHHDRVPGAATSNFLYGSSFGNQVSVTYTLAL